MSSTKTPIVAIVGRANVGKSSLFNAILKRREAIVAREAGTTRDSVWARADHDGQTFWLIDTAGMKPAEDDFELTIQEQILHAADSADVIWVVIEADTVITEEDRRVAKTALKSRKPVYLIVNKADKAPRADASDYLRLGIKQIYMTSTTQNSGIQDMLDDLLEDIPRVTKKDANDISVALLGRPNVGKSALFNALVKKQQAIVADRAGTTRDINRLTIKYKQKNIQLMDTAGIRRQGRIEKGIEQFSVLRSLAAIEQADVCLLLIDANELSVALDQRIAGMVKESGKGMIIVVSKWDIKEKDAFTRDSLAPKIAADYRFTPWAPLIFTSSVTGQNVSKLFDLILDIHEKRQTIIKTPDLNRWMRMITHKHPPAGLKNSQPHLNYIVQESDNPINFKIFGRQTKLLHWSYKRYMERELREKFGFEGTALKLWFFDKDQPGSHRYRATEEKTEN